MNTIHFALQLFAEGGAACGDGGGEAVSAEPAGQSSETRLRQLGVPEDRLQKRAKRVGAHRQSDAGGDAPAAGAQPTQSAGEQTCEQSPSNQPPAVREGRRSYDIRAHYDGMNRQAAEMAGKYPEFNLQQELDNPTFLRLTGPEIGLPLEDAYMALHHRELTRAIAERSRLELSNSIRAGSARPAEHGMDAKAPSVVTFDYRNATRSQRNAFKKQIYDAASRGEKIYPAQ